jgi:hypothetical protein
MALIPDAAKASSSNDKPEGLEFVERQVKFSRASLKGFSQMLKHSRFDPKTGLNELKFQLTGKGFVQANQSRINYIVKQKDGQTYETHLDSQRNGFFDTIKRKVSGKPYIYEELFSYKKGGFHDIRRRYFRQSNGLYRVEIARRESSSAPFVVKGNKEVSALQFGGMAEKRQCLENRTFMLDMNLIDSVNEIVEDFNIDWPALDFFEVPVTAEFDKSCDQKAKRFLGRNKSMSRLYEEALNEGLNCLQRLGQRSRDPNSFSNILYINSAAALAGQQVYMSPMNPQSMVDGVGGFPRRQPASQFEMQKVICSQRSDSFSYPDQGASEEGLGMASTRIGQTEGISCNGSHLKIKHPFISINFSKLQRDADTTNKYPQRDRENKLKELIFHEFLHTTGVEHSAHYDPVYACALHCFGGAPNDNTDAQARRICQGEGMGAFNQESVQERLHAQHDFNRGLNILSPRFYQDAIREISPEIGIPAAQNLMQDIQIGARR